MAIRPFLLWPDKRLRQATEPVGRVDEQVNTVWNDLLDTMYAMPGVGMGAPQIGVMLRLAVVDCSDGRNEPIRLANPEVVHASVKLREHEEASPNLPGLSAKVSRPRAVLVKYTDETGAEVERDFVGLWATSVQHQIDHLNGRMYFDHLSSTKRQMLIAKHNKSIRRGR